MRTFEVAILALEEIHRLPDAWNEAALHRLATILELEDIASYSPNELYEYLLMALQDAGHQKAGESVLEAVFGDAMRPGQRQNLVDDLQDKEPWQDFSTIHQQPGIFNTVVMMYDAFTNRYPNPDALRLTVSITPKKPDMSNGALSAADIVRLLAAGMADGDILNRLYEDDLRSGEFPQAEGILWNLLRIDNSNFEIISSRQWLGSLAKGDRYTAAIP